MGMTHPSNIYLLYRTLSIFSVLLVWFSSVTSVTIYDIPAMSTYDGTIDYRFDHGDSDTRIRFGVKNMFDERAPLADRYFGYFSDAHKDLGRNFYLDVRYRM